MENIEVEYAIVNDLMTDEEWYNVKTEKFVITKEMIIEILEKKVKYNHLVGEEFCTENFYLKLI
jgi:fructose-1,6-bisphosphatase/inositol monophosphatase family enzyme